MKKDTTMVFPPLLPGRIVHIEGRGEFFVRHHQHPDTTRPTVLLLHGWTASVDTQFFTAFEELSEHFSVIGLDHRGHGRGMRPSSPFALEDCADDAAAVARALGATSVVTVGYSMGGPISTLVWHRHRDLVKGMVLQATAMEWNTTRAERTRWLVSRYTGFLFRNIVTPRFLGAVLRRAIPRGHEMRRYIPWMLGEIRRNDSWFILQAGQALSRFDARPMVAEVAVPTAFVVTTKDTGVPVPKQRAFAAAVSAEQFELEGDHFATLTMPREFSAVTIRAVQSVVSRLP